MGKKKDITKEVDNDMISLYVDISISTSQFRKTSTVIQNWHGKDKWTQGFTRCWKSTASTIHLCVNNSLFLLGVQMTLAQDLKEVGNKQCPQWIFNIVMVTASHFVHFMSMSDNHAGHFPTVEEKSLTFDVYPCSANLPFT